MFGRVIKIVYICSRTLVTDCSLLSCTRRRTDGQTGNLSCSGGGLNMQHTMQLPEMLGIGHSVPDRLRALCCHIGDEGVRFGVK